MILDESILLPIAEIPWCPIVIYELRSSFLRIVTARIIAADGLEGLVFENDEFFKNQEYFLILNLILVQVFVSISYLIQAEDYEGTIFDMYCDCSIYQLLFFTYAHV